MSIEFRGTTICAVKKNGKTAIAGDGQVTFGESIVFKNNAVKVRRIYGGNVVIGFAGSVSDAFTLTERFEGMLNSETAKSFVKTSVNRPDECRSCRYKSLCRGGCRRECEPITSEKLSKNAYCDAYKGFFDECVDKMCDMAERINFMNRRGV